MIYATIPNTNDQVKFALLNYHHEKLGGREKSEIGNLQTCQWGKIQKSIFFIIFKKDIVKMGFTILLSIHCGRGRDSEKTNDQP